MAVDSAPDFKTSATLPPIPGLRFRHFAGPTDYPAMNDVANDAREANGVHNITDPDAFASYYAHIEPDHCALDRDLVMVDVNGELAGYARTELADEEVARVHYLVCFLRPAFRRQGIGRAMLEAIEERAIAVAADHPTDRPVFFNAETLGDPGADALLTATGYVPVRYHYVMVRPNLDPVPDARMPDRLEIRPVEDKHLRPICRRRRRGRSRPVGLHGADRGRTSTGSSPTRSSRPSDPSGGSPGTATRSPAKSGRSSITTTTSASARSAAGSSTSSSGRHGGGAGLARALIASSIDGLRERGMTEGALGVDIDNPSGALRLY